MLPGLRHYPVVRCDHQHGEIDGAYPRDHILDEFFMAGHIDKGDLGAEKGEAQVDGHAALVFLGEAVGIGAGQGLDEGGFAVIDVAGGADDDGHVLALPPPPNPDPDSRPPRHRLRRSG
ncbi:MAG: hypothetical protein BWY83_00822 [bacterium ADurb.Bin478]|nr:MAG: hypothetical protein BWY83_00822 [bacterium ADurb.Bin478]